MVLLRITFLLTFFVSVNRRTLDHSFTTLDNQLAFVCLLSVRSDPGNPFQDLDYIAKLQECSEVMYYTLFIDSCFRLA